MTKKSFIVLLTLSVIIWYISRFLQTLVAYFFTQGAISFFGAGCSATGYPIAICVSEFDSTRYVYYLINIMFWFAIIFGIKRFMLKKRKK